MATEITAAPDALDRCLARCGTDRLSLVASIDDVLGRRPGDLVLAVGSLAEGLGNRKSDLDLLLVADATGPERTETEVGWAIGRCVVDLRILHAATVERLTARLRDWARLPWSLVELAPFSYDERLLLHRLHSGLEVGPAEPDPAGPDAHPWRPRRSELTRLKLQVARHLARTIQVDMVGYRDESDHATLVFAAQDLLGNAIDGLLAAHGLTNPNPKWRCRLLRRLPPDWDRPLWLRPTGRRADDALWDLHRAPREPDRAAASAHALRCVSFARAVFAWAEQRVIGPGASGAVSPTWPPRDGRPPGPPLPHLEFDVDFCRTDTGAALARLNEFGASLRLSEREFAHVLLFDGRTTAVEAEAAVSGLRHGAPDPAGVARTVERVRDGGLCLPSPAPAEDPAVAVAALADELGRAGYGEFLTCFEPFTLNESAWRAARSAVPVALGPVVDLFLLGEAVPADTLAPGLRELTPGLAAAGLLTQRSDGLVETAGLIVLLACGNWILCHRPQPDPLCYLGEDSLALLGRLVPDGGRTALDLCAGPGIHAVHCARFTPEVTAVELDPRVARIARCNALLNGVADRVEVRSGDLYEPVAGRRFDLVVANPPTLPYPADLPGPRIGHGGDDGLRVLTRVLAGLPNALTDRGRAHLVGMALTDGTPVRLGDRFATTARQTGLTIRCSVVSHTPLGDAHFARLVAAVAAIAGADRVAVRAAYAGLLERLGATHLSAFFLHAAHGPGNLELTDIATDGAIGRWHV